MGLVLAPAGILYFVFHLQFPWPHLVSAGWLWLLYWLFNKWLARSREKESTPVSISEDSELGQIKHFKDNWQALVQIPGIAGQVEVLGDAPSPTASHRQTFKTICGRHSEFIRQFVDKSSDVVSEASGQTCKFEEKDVLLDGITLRDDEEGSFSLTFDISRHKDKMPWGLAADFEDYNITDVEVIH